jgi:hypothetical protein
LRCARSAEGHIIVCNWRNAAIDVRIVRRKYPAAPNLSSAIRIFVLKTLSSRWRPVPAPVPSWSRCAAPGSLRLAPLPQAQARLVLLPRRALPPVPARWSALARALEFRRQLRHLAMLFEHPWSYRHG